MSAWFLIIDSVQDIGMHVCVVVCVCVCVCMCVYLPLRLQITGRLIGRDMNPICLAKQALQRLRILQL